MSMESSAKRKNAEKTWRLMFDVSDILRHNSMKLDMPKPDGKITLGKLRVMGILFSRGGKPLMLKDIAEYYNITSGAVSQTIDALVEENVVERTQSKSDRRAVCIRLTEKGEHCRKRIEKLFTNQMLDVTKDIPDEKMLVFFEVMAALSRGLHQTNDK